MEEEINFEKFIGDDYSKISNEKFSLFAFLLGGCYLAYRKMIIEAVVVCLVELIFIFITLSILPVVVFLLLFIGLRVGEGFLFKKVYFNYVKSYINKIMNVENHSEIEIDELIQKNGGKAIIFLAVFAIVFYLIAISIGIIVTPSKSNKKSEVNNTPAPQNVINTEPDTNTNSNNTSNTTSDNNKKTITETDGNFTYKYVKNVKIKKCVEANIPTDIFKELTNDDYLYNYYVGESTFSTDIIVKIGEVSASSAEDFIKKVVKANDLTEDDMYSVEVNDLTWYIVGYESNGKIIYYNAFDNSGNVYLYRYEISTSVEDEYLTHTYEDIIYSIKAIKGVSDENKINSNSNTITNTVDTETTEVIENTDNTENQTEEVVEETQVVENQN